MSVIQPGSWAQRQLRERCRVLEKLDPEGWVWRVVLIEAGTSLNGAHYPAETLERAIPLYEKTVARIYKQETDSGRPYYDHCPDDYYWFLPEGVTTAACGWFEDVRLEEIESLRTGELVQALTADFHITDTWLRDTLNVAYDIHGRKDFLGFSHDAYCEWDLGVADGAYVDLITEILDVYEVTVVSTPAAGGGFLRKVAAVPLGGHEMKRTAKRLVAALKEKGKNPDELPQLVPTMTVQSVRRLLEGAGRRPSDQQLEALASQVGLEAAELKSLADQDEADRLRSLRESRRPLIQTLRALGHSESVEDRSDEELPGILVAALDRGMSGFSEGLRAEAERVKQLLSKERVTEAVQLLQDALLQYPVRASFSPGPSPAPTPAPTSGAGGTGAGGAAAGGAGNGGVRASEAELPAPLQAALDEIRRGQADLRAGQERLQREQREARISESGRLLRRLLEQSGLPETVQQLIESQNSGRLLSESQALDIIEEHRKALAPFVESGVRGMGSQGRVEVGADAVDRRCRRLDLMLGYQPEEAERRHYEGLRPYRGLREAYVDFTGDSEVTGFYGDAHLRSLDSRPRVQAMRAYESGRYREASTADFQYALGVSLTLRLHQMYRYAEPMWQKLAHVVDIENFKTQEIVRWGSFGEIPDVAEKGTYQELAAPADERATYTPTKKGAVFSLTWEMILNDDIRILRDVPNRFARAAHRRLDRDVFDLFVNWGGGPPAAVNGGTIFDGLALYADAHFNLVVSELSHSGLVLARQRLRKQFERGAKTTLSNSMNDSTGTMPVAAGTAAGRFSAGTVVTVDSEKMLVTGAPTGDNVPVQRGYDNTTPAAHNNGATVFVVGDYLELEPKYLVVPSELESTAIILRDSVQVPGSANNDVNQFKGKFEIIPVNTMRMRGNSRNWFLTADPVVAPIIEVGFVQGRREPDLFIQDQPTTGRVFMNDETTYKLRGAWGAVICDYKGVAGGLPDA